MPARTATAQWTGNLLQGQGHITTESRTLDAAYDFRGRAEKGPGTNPEELIAAAHAGCFTMQLSAILGNAGFTPARLSTSAKVHLEKDGPGFKIPLIELTLEGDVPGCAPADFKKHAETAKASCPVSRALAGCEIRLTVK